MPILTRAYNRTNEITGFIVDEEIPHNWIIDDLVVFKDLSVACAFSIDIPPFITLDDGTKDYFHSVLSSFMNTLGDEFELQFIWNVQRNCDDIIEHIGSNPPRNRIMQNYHKELIEKVRKESEANNIRRYKAVISIIRKPLFNEPEWFKRAKKEKDLRKKYDVYSEPYYFGKTIRELLGFGLAPNFSKKYAEKEWEYIKDQTYGAAAGLRTALRDLKLNPKILIEQELIDIMFEWWNPNSVHKGINAAEVTAEPLPITEYITMSNISVDKDKGYIYMDDQVHRILTLRTPPNVLEMNVFRNIVDNLDIRNIRIINNFRPYSREKRIQQLQNQLPILQHRAAKDVKLAVSIDEILSEIYSLEKKGEGCWNVTTILHIWGKDEEEVDGYVMDIKRLAQLCDGAKIVQETHAIFRYWLSAQPFWTRDEDMHRAHLYSTAQAVCLLPLSGHPEQFENEKLGVVLETAYGSLLNYNPLDSNRLNNYNALIIGSSGTGKSFLAGSIMMGMQSQNARVIGIDLGGSYKGLCEALNGAYITMDPNNKDQTINPLAVEIEDVTGYRGGDDNLVTPYQKEQITRFLEKALMEEGRSFSHKEKGFLDEVLNQMYLRAEGKEVYLSDLRQALQSYGKSETKEMADAMAMWCRGSKFGYLFDGPTKCDFDSPFTIFDMTIVKDNKDIAPLTIMSIMSNVYKMANNYPNVPKILLMDETWFLLQDPVTLKFVAECFRTFRKLNVSIIGVSQGIEEWLEGSASEILNNVLTYMILRQTNPKATEMASRALGLTSEQVSIINQLQTIKGEYSQALFLQQRQDADFSTVILNRPTPLQYAIMTTAPIDKEEIENIRVKYGLSHLDARIKFAELYPKGVR